MSNLSRARRLYENAAYNLRWLASLRMGPARRRAYLDRVRRDTFERIFAEARWGAQHLSGGGSTPDYTAVTRRIVVDAVRHHGIGSMLDLPCGDFAWMPGALEQLPPGFTYIGADISPGLIERNRARFPQRRFEVLDVVTDRLPPVELIFCRDALQHLPIPDIQRALENISASGAQYLLTTTYLRYYGLRNRRNIRPGRTRDRNLLLPPFNLADPLLLYSEQDPGHKFLGLWKLPLQYVD